MLPHVKVLAQLYDAEIVLFRALPKAEAMQSIRQDAEQALTELATSLRAEGIRTRFGLGIEPAGNAILAYAAGIEADMIAMATHARQGLSRLILGSVAEMVVQYGEKPVLIVKCETDD